MNVDQVIDQCTITGNVVMLPSIQLDRAVYTKVKKKLEGIGGKWNRKEQGFLFSNDPAVLLGRVQEGEDINLKKDFQFFETPEAIRQEMMTYVHSPDRTLEPSAGQGALISELIERCSVVYCELNPDNVKEIESKEFTSTEFACNDFMEYSIENKFELVFANPPFTKGQYCDHIRKMYDHLVSGGRVVTIAPIGFQFHTRGKEKQFREWLDNLDHQIVELPDDAFKSSGTMVKTCIIIIDN